MFERASLFPPAEMAAAPSSSDLAPSAPSVEELAVLVAALAGVDGAGVSDPVRVDQLDALERVKAACAAAQARVTAAFVASQAHTAAEWHARARACSDGGDFEGWRAARERARLSEFDPPALSRQASRRSRDGRDGCDDRVGRGRRSRGSGRPAGVAAQVGLARRESPARAARTVGVALALVGRLPHTLAALTAGTITERRAELVARGASHLSPALQGELDEQVLGAAGADAGTWGDRELEYRVRACADRLDAAAAAERARTAQAERRVTIRPVPDTMAVVSAVLPVAQAVALHTSLTVAAAEAKAAGDPRTKGQVMADTLVQRGTGQPDPGLVPVEVQLVITDRALLAGDDTPAHIPGYGPVPAGWARDLLTHDLNPDDVLHLDHHDADVPATDSHSDPGPDPGSDPGPDLELNPGPGLGSDSGLEGEAGAVGSDRYGEDDLGAGLGRRPQDQLAGDETRPEVRESRDRRRRPVVPRRAPAQHPAGQHPPAPSRPGQDPPGQDRPSGTVDAAGSRRARVWLRRLFTHPGTGTLVAMDSRRRRFDAGLRRFLITRDGTCRTPWCDAPIRHADHIHPHATGGPTTDVNGQGLCIRCNLVKEAPGWTHQVTDPGPTTGSRHPHTVQITTPTGHTHTSSAPPVLPGLPPLPALQEPEPESALERAIQLALAA